VSLAIFGSEPTNLVRAAAQNDAVDLTICQFLVGRAFDYLIAQRDPEELEVAKGLRVEGAHGVVLDVLV
jgi:hypothetical protein